jgi:hypothetical protein
VTPLGLLQRAIDPLQESGAHFAVAGGVAASFYRNRPRLTNDVDICLLATPETDSQNVAVRIIESLGLKPFHGWIASSGKLTDAAPLMIGKLNENDQSTSLDFLLPSLPWLKQGVIRAQENLIDFGFAKIPVLTPEDLLIAKLFALSIEPNRFQDRDDIQSILGQQNELDTAYLETELARHGLALPN